MTATTDTPTRERPILFSGPMVRAILECRKTVTRRVVKPQPDEVFERSGDVLLAWGEEARSVSVQCPYGRPGDLLWVRETWSDLAWHRSANGVVGAWQSEIIYAADGVDHYGPFDDPERVEREAIGWKPSIHMPKRHARLWLRVTDVRVERLHDIGEGDAVAEGMDWTAFKAGEAKGSNPRDSFRILWDELNADRGHGWDQNPWVWRIAFERAEAPAREAP